MMRRLTIDSRWLLIALMLAAFAVRLYRLDAQSLWSDEGLSLYRARLSPGENLTNVIVVPPGVATRDTNPPLYFIALSALRLVAGESEYALRFLSVIMGVLTVPLLYVLGKRLWDGRGGMVAATLAAVSPFLVWYSQEARMYTSLAALSVASTYALLRAVEPGSPQSIRRWLTWAFVTAAALYTHFTAFFLLPFEGLLIFSVIWHANRRRALVAVLMLIGLGVPIGLYGWSRVQAGAGPSFGFRPLYSIAEELSSAFAVGRTNETFQPLWLVAPSLLALTIGVVSSAIKQRRSAWIMLMYLLLPLLTFYAVTLVWPLFSGARHLTLIAPPFYLLLGYGASVAVQRARWIGMLLLAVILAPMAYWLHVQFFDPAYLKDDMRSAARLISERATADDVVIVHDAISSFVFDYYYTGKAPWRIIPEYPSLRVDAAIREFQLQATTAQRVWFVTDPGPLSGFPKQALDEWARGHLLRLDHARFASLWLGSAYQLYTAHYPIFDSLPTEAAPSNAAWPSDDLKLLGWRAESMGAAQLRVSLFWQLSAPGQRNLSTALKLFDANGATMADTGGTMFDNWSVRDWPVGKIIQQTTLIDLPLDRPPGQYHLQLIVSERKSGEPLVTANGVADVDLGPMMIEAAK
jgi:4-amino-4-deoxy-L-arabinose transferase-like glycosyltransferase